MAVAVGNVGREQLDLSCCSPGNCHLPLYTQTISVIWLCSSARDEVTDRERRNQNIKKNLLVKETKILHHLFSVYGEGGLPANWTLGLGPLCTDPCLEWGCIKFFVHFVWRGQKFLCTLNVTYLRAVDRNKWIRFSITCIYTIMYSF